MELSSLRETDDTEVPSVGLELVDDGRERTATDLDMAMRMLVKLLVGSSVAAGACRGGRGACGEGEVDRWLEGGRRSWFGEGARLEADLSSGVELAAARARGAARRRVGESRGWR